MFTHRLRAAGALHPPGCSAIAAMLNRRRLLACLAALVAFCWTDTLPASDPLPITRVEEDWRIEIGVPDPAEDSPQIITVLSSTQSLEGVYALFELNHATVPQYGAGGLQLQTWLDESNLDYRNSPKIDRLGTENENITFTMAMSLHDGQLNFEVLDGHSTTWGDFGGQGYLKSALPSTLTSLSGYNSQTSVKHSRVGFASHRVKKLVRTQVRYYSSGGLVATDSEEQVVHAYDGGN